jgi:hypothetical protein
MALNTYAAIKTAVADWSYNGGGVTAALVGTDFFPQVQAMMYRGHGTDIDPLRISAMVDSATITPATGGIITISTQVDTGWLEFIEMVPTSNGAVSINYVPPWDFRKNAYAIQSTAAPQYIYTIEGDSLYLAPASVQPIAAKWYQKFTAVSGDSDTDWIILNAPQVYLDGCLMLACAYTQDEREAAFRAKFAAGIKGLNLNDQRARSSGSVKVSRPRVVV